MRLRRLRSTQSACCAAPHWATTSACSQRYEGPGCRSTTDGAALETTGYPHPASRARACSVSCTMANESSCVSASADMLCRMTGATAIVGRVGAGPAKARSGSTIEARASARGCVMILARVESEGELSLREIALRRLLRLGFINRQPFFFDVEPHAAEEAHVEVGQPYQREKGDEISSPVVE